MSSTRPASNAARPRGVPQHRPLSHPRPPAQPPSNATTSASWSPRSALANAARCADATLIRPQVRLMVDAFADFPAFVSNRYFDIVAANDLGRALYAPRFDTVGRDTVNTARFHFHAEDAARDFWVDSVAESDRGQDSRGWEKVLCSSKRSLMQGSWSQDWLRYTLSPPDRVAMRRITPRGAGPHRRTFLARRGRPIAYSDSFGLPVPLRR